MYERHARSQNILKIVHFSRWSRNRERKIQLHPESDCLFMPFVMILKIRKYGASDTMKPVVLVQIRRSKYRVVDTYDDGVLINTTSNR